jgi:hypothetical protein
VRAFGVELFAGLHGWGEGMLAEGFDVIGFDIEDMCAKFGHARPAGIQLILQDVLTLHGSQFRNASLIVASPPCQAYSYRAMPWKRAKALPPPDNSLFEACFRIQREACEAAGRHIPMVVENVRGAQKWVGSAAWHFGSYFLWGDVPALMPIARKFKNPGFRFDGSGRSFQSESVKNAGTQWRDSGCNAENRMVPAIVPGLDWSAYGKPGYKAKGFNVVAAQRHRDGVKSAALSDVDKALPSKGARFWPGDITRKQSSRSDSRKAASAAIAKIPFPLARHIAHCFAARAIPEGS